MGLQVYEATHRDGELLPVVERAFISFKWGDKNIEDFDLIATIDGDRINDEVYFGFEEVVSSVEGRSGQLYWGSTRKPGELTLSLATDGMTLRTYEQFRKYFIPDVERKLYYSETSNRYCWARLKAAPQMSMLPFEDVKDFNGQKFRTTLYKGSISIVFAVDDPYWYSDISFINAAMDKELAAKLVYEDNLPHYTTNKSGKNCLIADNYVWSSSNTFYTNPGIAISSSSPAYLYNCGTSYTKPIISFDYTYNINSSPDSGIIYFTSQEKNGQFSFNMPTIVMACKQILQLSSQFVGQPLVNFRAKIRDVVSHSSIRTEICSILSSYIADGKLNYSSALRTTIEGILSSALTNIKFSFSFDSNNGKAIVSYKSPFNGAAIEENCGDSIKEGFFILDVQNSYQEDLFLYEQDLTKITPSIGLTNFKINFKYTY